jgi:hypothetical protein
VTSARIHDARFVDVKGPEGVKRLEVSLSFDLPGATGVEIVRSRVSMLSLERPDGNIHPVLGFLLFAGLQPYGLAQRGASHAPMSAQASQAAA